VPAHGVPTSDACRPQLPDELTAAVVVTTCVASRSLARTLEGILLQSKPPAEIIVVDNRPSTSGVREQLDRFPADVRYVAEPIQGLSRARNAGLAAATAPVIAYTDDDVEVDSRWLEFLLSGFTDDQVACVTGMILPLELATPAQVWFEQFGGFGKGFSRRRFDLVDHRSGDLLYPYAAGVFGSGANSAFRAATLRRLGGFDEYLGAGTPGRGGEDLDIFLSVVQSGQALVYEPAALLRHAHKRTMAELHRQLHDYGVGLGAMVTKRVMTRPAERGPIARLVPGGMRHLLNPGSPKNAGKSSHYPRSLTLAELAGLAWGPVVYTASRVRCRK
jgi:glycosyltransferase involved in cell wall biosynthesis